MKTKRKLSLVREVMSKSITRPYLGSQSHQEEGKKRRGQRGDTPRLGDSGRLPAEAAWNSVLTIVGTFVTVFQKNTVHKGMAWSGYVDC